MSEFIDLEDFEADVDQQVDLLPSIQIEEVEEGEEEDNLSSLLHPEMFYHEQQGSTRVTSVSKVASFGRNLDGLFQTGIALILLDGAHCKYNAATRPYQRVMEHLGVVKPNFLVGNDHVFQVATYKRADFAQASHFVCDRRRPLDDKVTRMETSLGRQIFVRKKIPANMLLRVENSYLTGRKPFFAWKVKPTQKLLQDYFQHTGVISEIDQYKSMSKEERKEVRFYRFPREWLPALDNKERHDLYRSFHPEGTELSLPEEKLNVIIAHAVERFVSLADLDDQAATRAALVDLLQDDDAREEFLDTLETGIGNPDHPEMKLYPYVHVYSGVPSDNERMGAPLDYFEPEDEFEEEEEDEEVPGRKPVHPSRKLKPRKMVPSVPLTDVKSVLAYEKQMLSPEGQHAMYLGAALPTFSAGMFELTHYAHEYNISCAILGARRMPVGMMTWEYGNTILNRLLISAQLQDQHIFHCRFELSLVTYTQSRQTNSGNGGVASYKLGWHECSDTYIRFDGLLLGTDAPSDTPISTVFNNLLVQEVLAGRVSATGLQQYPIQFVMNSIPVDNESVNVHSCWLDGDQLKCASDNTLALSLSKHARGLHSLFPETLQPYIFGEPGICVLNPREFVTSTEPLMLGFRFQEDIVRRQYHDAMQFGLYNPSDRSCMSNFDMVAMSDRQSAEPRHGAVALPGPKPNATLLHSKSKAKKKQTKYASRARTHARKGKHGRAGRGRGGDRGRGRGSRRQSPGIPDYGHWSHGIPPQGHPQYPTTQQVSSNTSLPSGSPAMGYPPYPAPHTVPQYAYGSGSGFAGGYSAHPDWGHHQWTNQDPRQYGYPGNQNPPRFDGGGRRSASPGVAASRRDSRQHDLRRDDAGRDSLRRQESQSQSQRASGVDVSASDINFERQGFDTEYPTFRPDGKEAPDFVWKGISFQDYMLVDEFVNLSDTGRAVAASHAILGKMRGNGSVHASWTHSFKSNQGNQQIARAILAEFAPHSVPHRWMKFPMPNG